ncbi:N-acetylmuramoyl-L-alanine amidase [Clostridium lundense]|uniref:N-acetylmuramoyl-L-alanine amidase n=1 Tax=Clostridium lundense TaxID=319475 RepID=UPI00068756D6|nr:N-acetylmuramoyl-L-alanine amidase [Clostridium lundense]
MKIAIDFGHGTGEDRGAEGYLNEEKAIREYGELVIDGLKLLGHTVINVTPATANLSLGQSLAYRVNAANNYKTDLFISLHVNAFRKDKARGCEVEYISDAGKGYADKICTEISKLGFVNRGSQKRTNLYVLKYTSMIAILVEPFFCDNREDCNLYSPKKLANAIIKGITGVDVYTEEENVTRNEKVEEGKRSNVLAIDHSIPNSPGVHAFPGGFGYFQIIPNSGRIDIHLDRYNYLTIQDDEKEGNRVIITTRTKGSKSLF